MKKNLNIRPDTDVYGTYKRISYQPWTALAEFVDNSTQSFYDHRNELLETKYYKRLEIEINYTENSEIGDEIVIRDNAFGMDFSDFKRALILNKPPKNTNGRNEFGMGLKAAACWFGNLWSVETTMLGSSFKYKAEIDVDNLVRYKKEDITFDEDSANPKEHYTIITIRKLNKKIKGKRIEKKVHDLLSSIYRVDLRSGDIKIFYNGNALKFDEVKPYTDELGKQWKKEVDFTIPHKGEELHVKGFIGIRLPGSPQNGGFTLLRRGRVIVGGPEKNYRPIEVCGPINLFAAQRLYGELEMDDWPVTQAKDAFDWNNEDLEAKFIEKLIDVSKDYRKKAENIRVREKVNAHDLKESFKKTFENNEHISNLEIKLQDSSQRIVSNFGNSDDDSSKSENNEFGIEDKESAGVGVEIEENQPINISMKYRNKPYNFIFIFDDKNKHSEWLKLEEINRETNKYKLTLNALHLFFYPFIQKKDFLVVLAKFATALVIAELNSYGIAQNGKISPSSIRIAMGQILEDFTNE